MFEKILLFVNRIQLKLRIRLKNWRFVNAKQKRNKQQHSTWWPTEKSITAHWAVPLADSIKYHLQVCNYWVVNQFEERAVLRMRQIIRGNVADNRKRVRCLNLSIWKSPTFVLQPINVCSMQKLYTGLASRRFLFLYCLIKLRFGFQANYYITTHRWFIFNDILINYYKFYGPNQMLECVCVCLCACSFITFDAFLPINQFGSAFGKKDWEEKARKNEEKIIQLKWNEMCLSAGSLRSESHAPQMNAISFICAHCVYHTVRCGVFSSGCPWPIGVNFYHKTHNGWWCDHKMCGLFVYLFVFFLLVFWCMRSFG